VLKKLAPETITLCPAEPLAGLSEEITGGPAGSTATVVDVDVAGVNVVGVVAGAAPLREPVGGEWDGTVVCPPDGVACPDGAPVEDVGVELPLNETINAMAAAATRTATTVTVPINQRSGRAGGAGVSPGGADGGLSCGGATSTRLVGGWARGSGGGGSGGAPADSRARRTALSIAPRAR
jgi:hypothetical protein